MLRVYMFLHNWKKYVLRNCRKELVVCTCAAKWPRFLAWHVKEPDIEGFLKEPPNIIVDCLACIGKTGLSLCLEKVHLAETPVFYPYTLRGFQLCYSHMQHAGLGVFMCLSTNLNALIPKDITKPGDVFIATSCLMSLCPKNPVYRSAPSCFPK